MTAAAMPAPPSHGSDVRPVRDAARLDWLDVLRTLAILQIIGFHWLRTCQDNGAFGLVWSPVYENVGTGLHQLTYLLTDQTGLSVSSVINNAIGVVFAYGWEAVDVFVLLSGTGLALTYRPANSRPARPEGNPAARPEGNPPGRPGFSLLSWYLRRFRRILLPYYLIALPLILVAEVLKYAGSGRAGVLGQLAQKLTVKNLPDPLGIELAKHAFLVDPRQAFWTVDFFSPAWWFIPPILVGYLAFPLYYRGLARLGLAVMLPATFVVSAIAYTLTSYSLLWEHGWYFVILHEGCDFTIGIAIGRALASPEGRVRITRFIEAPACLLIGTAVFLGGNVAHWFSVLHPLSSPVFTLGFVMVLAWVSARLARIRGVLALSRMTDGYHVYLLHQWIAFPLVVVTATLAGPAARAAGFSLGFVAYLLLAFLVALAFEAVWRRVQALGPRARGPEARGQEALDQKGRPTAGLQRRDA